MINFPVFETLDVDGYGLFPGEDGRDSGLHVQFRPGLTLFLGANGLGKTTVVTMMFRMLTGPFDIPGLSGSGALGSTKLTPTALPYSSRTMFSQRVSDGARNATAKMTFRLGKDLVHVERRLADLSLTRFSVNEEEPSNDEVGAYQEQIPRLAGVWSFGDWIVMLRHLVFYFEDRRALVWDASAQRQVLRLLLLPAATARKWAEDEREILELDSQSRNLSATLYSQERALATSELKITTEEGVRAELATLDGLQAHDTEALAEFNDNFVGLDEARQGARLRLLTSEQERESRYRELEHAKLLAVEARFPSKDETARYILAQLMTDSLCLVCGNQAPQAAADLEARIRAERCVVCGSDVSRGDETVLTSEVSDRRVKKAFSELAAIDGEVKETRRQLREVTQEYDALVNAVARLNSQIAERSARMDSLVRRLPPEEGELHEQRNELALLRGRLEVLRESLKSRREAFATFIEARSRTMVVRSSEIQASFGHHAEEFLVDECRLVWSPQEARVGQTGQPIEFPAFEFEMTGASFPSLVRRTGPEQVSESQREFIDLAFRMALMQVAGSTGVGSLVIDAPESSLDAVFVGRAANVLARFADANRGNRLVITSNLVEGQLIPNLLELTADTKDRHSRLVDLFRIAEPTAAVRQHRAEYDAVLAQMIDVTTEPRPQPKQARPRRRGRAPTPPRKGRREN